MHGCFSLLSLSHSQALSHCLTHTPSVPPTHTHTAPAPATAASSFLAAHAASLNWHTTTSLLESYGRLEELEAFAAAKGDQEALLEYLMRAPGDGAKRCGAAPITASLACILLPVH